MWHAHPPVPCRTGCSKDSPRHLLAREAENLAHLPPQRGGRHWGRLQRHMRLAWSCQSSQKHQAIQRFRRIGPDGCPCGGLVKDLSGRVAKPVGELHSWPAQATPHDSPQANTLKLSESYMFTPHLLNY